MTGIPLAIAFATVLLGADGGARAGAVQSVPVLDLTRYAGRWYEVARYPNRFQKRCAGDVTADYVLGPEGDLTVVNQCRLPDGSVDRAEGAARRANPGGPDAQLKVRFAPRWLSFLPVVWGDYWVIALGANYEYAVVGDPSRDYLWILSRTPAMDEARYRSALDAAVSNGFDPTRLVKTNQTGA